MASNGQYLAIGAPGNAAANAPGAVWVYDTTGGQFTLLTLLQAPNPVAADGFGHHVTFAGNQLLVGAPFRTVSGLAAHGEVFVYNTTGGAFSLQQTIAPGVAVSSNDWFGFHLSADAGWLAVGVPKANANDRGQIQIYLLDTGTNTWTFHSAVTATVNFGRFGTRVLVRGDRVLASAIQEKPSNLAATAGYVYEYLRSGNGAGSTFAQTQRFRPTTYPASDPVQAFGSSLALSPDGSQLAVGAPTDEESAGDVRGAVFTFTRVAGAWTQSQRIASPAAALAENFGGATAFASNTLLLISDAQEMNNSSTVTGAAYEFNRPTAPPGQPWSLGRSWLNSSGAAQDLFGSGLGSHGGVVIIGSAGRDDAVSGSDVGRVYVFSAVFKNGFE